MANMCSGFERKDRRVPFFLQWSLMDTNKHKLGEHQAYILDSLSYDFN